MTINANYATRYTISVIYLQVEVHEGSGILLQHQLEDSGHKTHAEQTPVVVCLFLLHHLHEHKHTRTVHLTVHKQNP